jgi:predicted DNA-binding WGR domain protein
MKLAKRTTLYCQEGSSDKVYEVDLCEISKGKYVVNFRYGRRGTTLKEGVKTTTPVDLTQAQQIFNKLVAEKTRKGYREETTATPVTEPTKTPPVIDPNARKQAILQRLENNQPSTWKLERAIWRAGELRIKEATPLLLKLIGTGTPLRNYCIAWSLGYCGGEEAIPALIQLYQNPSSPEFVSRISFEALLKLADAPTKAALQTEMIEFLPPQLQPLARNGSAEAFATELNHYLQHSDYKSFAVLDKIYQIDNKHVRPALLDILRAAPLQPNYFQRIRHIFKMAEYRGDAEVFAILAYCFEKVPERFDNYGRNRALNKRRFTEDLKQPDSKKAYSKQTREYLLRRIWRTLKTLGEDGEADYVKMAIAILLQHQDTDAEEIKDTVYYRWEYSNRRYTRIETRRNSWDAFAKYTTLNHILYENSPRYELKTSSPIWRCRENYKLGDPEPTNREEAFPELWDKQPQALLQLLTESNCHPVHNFAVKAIKKSVSFCASINNIDTIVQLLNKLYEITAQFGFEIAQQNYNPHEPNKKLIIALANCLSQQANQTAHQWIESQREYFLQDNNFLVELVFSNQTETRTFARKLLNTSNFSETAAKIIIGLIITELQTLPEGQGELAKDISQTLLSSFPTQLRTLGLSAINDLLKNPLLEIQELGVNILLNHEIKAENLPPQIIESLLASPQESLRILGIRLFGQQPDAKLIAEESTLILAIAINPNPEIRNAIKPIIQRLGANHPTFTRQIASEFIEILLLPEKHEGVHSFILQLLRSELQNWMTSIPKQTASQLLKNKSTAAQELGGLILAANHQTWTPEFTTSEIVKLADHEIVAVRQAAQQMFSQNLQRLRTDQQEMLDAVKILEAKWQDTRDFAYQIFTNQFSDNEFTPVVLISICDSVRTEARKLGRDLLTRNFRSSDGEEYLLKLSEHPSADMQLFATNYLEENARNNPQKLQELTPYFLSILSRVNRGSIAKKRILNFLEAEALHSETSAKIVTEIMTRQSATIAISDKAATIQIMLKIHQKYPHIQQPIQIKQIVEIRC